ncbi:MAG: hypothetical protein GX220_07525 [Treponema sp.]|nr:hypothetical protein [Treponema sp.]
MEPLPSAVCASEISKSAAIGVVAGCNEGSLHSSTTTAAVHSDANLSPVSA